jgi:transketolase C-terminal domain/subunit/glycosyltransferase involved in cell wall biosynthesis
MRGAFVDALMALAERDERVWLLTGDLGYTVLERFRERFPDRFVNAGVAEQNMTGVAAGLALSGKIVFTYSIANFPTIRCLEQVRNDVCYHNLDVKIVAVGGGVVYGPLGYTHHAVEDLAIMRALPNLAVIAPGDPVEVRLAVRALAERRGPVYLRLGRAAETIVHRTEPPFEIGRPIVLRDGEDAVLVSVGGMLANVDEAAGLLAAEGRRVRVVSLHTLKPLDVAALVQAVAGPRRVFFVAEHTEAGGPGELAASLLNGALPRDVSLHSLCLRRGSIVGRRDYILAENGLDPGGIAASVRRELAAGARRSAGPVEPSRPRKLISILTPCYNESENVRDCYLAVRRLFETTLANYDYEHIFADNASTDDTVRILKEIAADDPRVKIIVNARNFGPFRSAFNALLSARGDAVLVFLAADLQDPPEMIPEFIRRWEDGHEVVYAVRKRREESAVLRFLRRVYYRIVDKFAYASIPPDVGEFQLIDRVVVEALRRFDDYYPYIRGMIAMCGFRSTGIDYTWRARRKGISKNRWYHLVDQGLNGIISFSNAPMRICGMIGLVLSALSILYAAIQFGINVLFLREFAAPGIATLIVALFFFSGVQLLFLGVVGEYVMATHAQVRRRPLVIERERVNFELPVGETEAPSVRIAQ